MSTEPHGILNLHKPTGPTSHDCVGKVRRALHTRRVGHAGTLDPLASGVLVLGIGHGTRILEYLQGLPKIYRAELRLGVETDSQDTTGAVLAESDPSAVTEALLREALSRFHGEVDQVPPMVSALKVGGKRLYELARQGETVERQPRRVTFYRTELLRFTPGRTASAEVRVECSAGTYIRTLCHDLGRLLGTGAAMSALEREAVGPFTVADAVPLEHLTAETPLLSTAAALGHLPSLVVDDAGARRLAHGQSVPAPADLPDGPVRVLSEDGRLLAVGTACGLNAARLLAPDKVFTGA